MAGNSKNDIIKASESGEKNTLMFLQFKRKKRFSLGAFVICASFLFVLGISFDASATTTPQSLSTYQKPESGTLFHTDWNNLIVDFVKTWGDSTVSGNLIFPSTTNASKNGIIYKNSVPFIHDFNYGYNGATTTAGQNIFVGAGAGNLTMGASATNPGNASLNTAVGYEALHLNTLGGGNSALGRFSLYSNTSGSGNSAVGVNSLYSNTYGANNSAVGSSALFSNTGGSYNSALGYNAGRYIYDGINGNTTGSYSVFLGQDSRALGDNQSNQIVIGYNAIGAGSNSAVLGNASITKTVLRGYVGISTTSPQAALDVYDGNIFIRDAVITSLTPKAAITKEYLDSSLSSTTASIITQVATSSFWQGAMDDDIWNNNVGNVGIGTTNPYNKLDVEGKVGARSFSFQHQTNPFSASSERFNLSYSNPGITNGLSFMDSAGSLRMWIGHSTIGNNNIVLNPTLGNVGIGTTSPSQRLTVAGNVGFDTGKFTTDGSGNATFESFRDQSNALYKLDPSDAGTSLNIAGSVNSLGTTNSNYFAGNVGVGITDPGAKLAVVGNSGIIGRFVQNATWTGSEYALSVYGYTNLNNFRINGADGARSLYLTTSGGQLGFASNNGIITFTNGSLGTTERMRIDAVGNVGIGTSAPGSNLDVNGTDQSAAIRVSMSGIPTVYSALTSNSLTMNRNTGSTVNLNIKTTLNSGTWGAGGGDILFSPNNSELVRLTAGGLVGIGTTAPTAKLDVNGTFRVSGALNSVVLDKLSGSGSRIVMTDSSGSLYATSTTVATGLPDPSAAGNGATLRSNGSSWVANTNIFNNGANVGIGTVSLASKLNVYENTTKVGSGAGLTIEQAGTGDAILHLLLTGVRRYQIGIDNSDGDKLKLGVGDDWSTRTDLTINTSGNVGIGTTTPTQKLTVAGNVGFDTGKFTTDGSGNATFESFRDQSNALYKLDPSDTNTSLYTAGTVSALGTVTDNYFAGNVGIGVADPSSKLFVVGHGRFGSSASAYLDVYGNGTSANVGQNVNSAIPVSVYGAGDVQINLDSNNNETNRVFSVRTNALQNGTELFRVQENGNVGIGTNQPVTLLHVNGNGATVDAMALITAFTSTRSRFAYWDPAAPNTKVAFGSGWGVATDFAVHTKTSGDFSELTQRLTVKNNGNVGIGTSSPVSLLDVNGLIKMRTALISQPEDVINKGYLESALSGGEGFSSLAGFWKLNGSDLYASSTSWNVGVGITNPAGKLQIYGSGSAPTASSSASQLIISSSNNRIEFGTPEIGNARYAWILARHDTADSFGGYYSTLHLQPDISGTEVDYEGVAIGYDPTIKLNSSAGLAVSGNVGIGTSSPASRLHLGGNENTRRIRGLNVIPLADDEAVARKYLHDNFAPIVGGASLWATSSAGTYNVGLGNVGIGTTAPTKKLDVNGDLLVRNAATFSSSITASLLNGAAGRLVSVDANGTFGAITAASSGQTLRFTGSAWVPNSVIYNNGTNVGIGTASPSGKLGVLQNMSNYNSSFTSPHLKLQAGNIVDNTGFVGIAYEASTAPNYGWSSGSFRGSTSGVLTSFIWKYHNNDAAGVEYMRISHSGSVGIGTTAPTKKLDVNGDLLVRNAATFSSSITASLLSGTAGRLVAVDASGTLYATSSSVATGLPEPTSAGDGATLRSNGTSWIANTNIFNNGTGVGIGTSNPGSLLTIANNNWISGRNSADTGVVNMFKLNASNQIEVGAPLLIGPLEFAADSGLISFTDMPVTAASLVGTPQGYVMKIDGNNLLTVYSESNGSGGIQNSRVGIGTASPTQTLTVAGNVGFDSSQFTTDGSGTATFESFRDVSNSLYKLDPSDTNTSLYVAGTVSALGTATNNYFAGNVGIGITNPGAYKLYVNGNTNVNGSVTWSGGNSSHLGTGANVTTYVGNSSVNNAIIRSNNNSNDAWLMNWGDSPTYGIYNRNIESDLAVAGALTVPSNSTAFIGAGLAKAYIQHSTGNAGFAGTLSVGGNATFSQPVIVGAPTNPAHAATKNYVDSIIATTSDFSVGFWTKASGKLYPTDTSLNVGIGVTNPLAKLHLNGGLIMKTSFVANTNYTAQAADYIIAYSSITADRIVTLPNSLCTPGRFFIVMDQSGSANSGAKIIIDPEGTTPIVGGSTFMISNPYNAVYVFCGNNAWFLL